MYLPSLNNIIKEYCWIFLLLDVMNEFIDVAIICSHEWYGEFARVYCLSIWIFSI